MNECHFLGRLTHDPEVKYLQQGAAVANFSIAVSRQYKTQGGEKAEEVAFLSCEAWSKGAETIAQYFKKGDPIIIHASAKTEQWETEGVKRSKTVFRVNKFEFVPRSKQAPKDDAGGGDDGGNEPAPSRGGSNNPPPDDEIPF